MMNFIKISTIIFLILALTRFLPHPPNFTSLITLSFYVPLIFGRKFILSVVLSFAITDIFLGLHSTVLFTWGSVFIIGMISTYFKKNLLTRMTGAVTSVVIFFVITNLGILLINPYDHNVGSLLDTFSLTIPFFLYSMISTIIFSIIIEIIYWINKTIRVKVR